MFAFVRRKKKDGKTGRREDGGELVIREQTSEFSSPGWFVLKSWHDKIRSFGELRSKQMTRCCNRTPDENRQSGSAHGPHVLSVVFCYDQIAKMT